MEEEDEVRLASEGRHVWLVRIPPSISNIWKNVEEGDTCLGKIRIYPAVDGKRPEVTLHLNETEEIPVGKLKPVNDYKIRFNPDVPKLRVFSEGAGGVEMQGIVEDSCMLQPTRSKEYTDFQKNRNSLANVKTAIVKEMTYADERKQMEAKKRRIIPIRVERPSTKKIKKVVNARVLTEKELREVIFGLFAEKDEEGKRCTHWTIKEIRDRTGQQESLIRDVLKQICIYHRSGEFARYYELKPEFK